MNENLPLIGVVMAVYNCEAYIRQCLDSIVNQTYKKLEILIVDDGSTDNSGAICDEYAVKDSRIKVFHQKNAGASEAKNFARMHLTAPYFIALDSDDYISVEMIARAVETMQTYNVDMVMWNYSRVVEDKTYIKTPGFLHDGYYDEAACQTLRRQIVGLITKEELKYYQNFDMLSTESTKLYKTDSMKKLGIKRVDLNKIGSFEDGLCNIEYFKCVKSAYFINEPLFYLRHRKTSHLGSYNSRYFQQQKHLFDLIAALLDREGLTDEAYKMALNRRREELILIAGMRLFDSNLQVSQKQKELKKMLTDADLAPYFRATDLSPLPFKWKVFFFFVKFNLPTLLGLMLNAINYLKSKGVRG